MKVRQHRHKLYTESVIPGSIPQQERLVNPKWDTMHKTTQILSCTGPSLINLQFLKPKFQNIMHQAGILLQS